MVTREEFQEYREVQNSGAYNMFSPQARAMTSLSKDTWIDIIKNYSDLKNKYEGGDDE